MAFPEINLDAINRQAALLFARKDATTDDAKSLVSDLRAELHRIDNAISSINGQLHTRTDDPAWRKSANLALTKYREQKISVAVLLKTARAALETISQHLISERRIKEKQIARDNILITEEVGARERERRHAAKLKNIAAASEESHRFEVAFRKIVRREFGEEVFNRLITTTQQELGTVR
jgi:hypothetical protein